MFRVITCNIAKHKSLTRLSLLNNNNKTQVAGAHAASPTVTDHHDHALALEQKDIYPRAGNREIVGFGRNGEPQYFDAVDCPCPSIRWEVDTPEIKQLREKAKGDWSALSIAEKKALYRADFRSTFAEMVADDAGEWKFTLGSILAIIGSAIWMYYFFSKTIYNYPQPKTFTLEHQYGMLERMIAEGQGRVHGVSSEWDYEKGDWKANTKAK